MESLNKTAHYPFTYGDDVANNEKRLSDFVVRKLSQKKTQKYIGGLVMAMFALGCQAAPVRGIPAEYGEAANELLNQAAQNVAGLGGTPVIPPIGRVEGQVPVPQVNPQPQQFVLKAMPVEQQRLIAAQQCNYLVEGMPKGPGIGIGETGPTGPPSFYLPGKPQLTGPRAANTVAFIAALGIICLNAVWGEPVAIVMCASGLLTIGLKVGKDVVVFAMDHIKIV